ncbi:MAG: gluconokinase [Verrucomicrobiota bacterium]
MPRPDPRALVLAVDIGTSSVRSALFDAAGRRLPGTTGQTECRLLRDVDGKAEMDAVALASVQLHGCLAQTLRRYRRDQTLRGRPIVAAGTSCFWHSLVGIGPSGDALTTVYTWADSRGAADAARLRAPAGVEARAHRRTGAMLRASFWAPKLRWLRRTQPRLFKNVETWISPAELAARYLTDSDQVSVSMASGTGLMNYRTCRWDTEALKLAGIGRGQLPAIGDEPGRCKLSGNFNAPELSDTLWFPAIGDGAASNLGSGAVRPGLAAINVGTSAAVRVVVDTRQHPRQSAPLGLFAYRVDERRGLLGGAVSNAGNLRAWCLRELNLPDDEAAIERALAGRDHPRHGLTVLPFWVSERAPTWNEDLRGAVLGLSGATTSLDLLQAITEASYLRLAAIARQLETAQRRPLRFLVSGGIQQSPSSLQRLADVLNAPVEASAEPEASLRGAAIFALEKIGGKAQPLAKGTVYRPRKKAAAAYAAARKQQEKLERMMAGAGRAAGLA